MNDKSCTREHLQAAVNIYYMYNTKGDGDLGDYWEQWDDPLDSQMDNIEEYHCSNCGEYFTPSEQNHSKAIAEAWQAALAHLRVEAKS